MGSSILDAMTHKLPVVATEVGGIPEVVIHRESGLLVPPREPNALAHSIMDLYKNPSFAARLGRRGYENVRRKFSAESMARKILLVYENLARKKKVKLPVQS